jgi:hypothetical protein
MVSRRGIRSMGPLPPSLYVRTVAMRGLTISRRFPCFRFAVTDQNTTANYRSAFYQVHIRSKYGRTNRTNVGSRKAVCVLQAPAQHNGDYFRVFYGPRPTSSHEYFNSIDLNGGILRIPSHPLLICVTQCHAVGSRDPGGLGLNTSVTPPHIF